MTKQIINVGTSPNSKNGDPLRAAFIKINENFDELYTFNGVSNFTELAQDYAAAMFVNGDHEGISVEYDDVSNQFNLTVVQDYDGGSASTVYDNDISIDGGGA